MRNPLQSLPEAHWSMLFGNSRESCRSCHMRTTSAFHGHGQNIWSQQQNIIIVADSQSSSQLGDIGRFSDVTLITPTEREARLAIKDKHSGLVKVAEEVQSLVNSRDVILTLGSEGVFLRTKNPEFEIWQDDRIPALNRAPKDVAGAGDAFLVGSALATAIGVSIWEAAYIGSMAAACQVGRVGNIPLSVKELTDQLPH